MIKSKLFRVFLSVTLSGFVGTAFSAALIEQSGDANNPPSKMWLQGMKMRVDVNKEGQYMLIDLDKKKMYMVDPSRKIILDNSQMFTQGQAQDSGLKVEVKHMGSGPVIAGYKTQKYSMSVNGQQCDQLLISKKAMYDTGMQNRMEAMTSMGHDSHSMCDRAEKQFAKRMKKLGFPLGVVKDGNVKINVTRIVKNATPPAGGFNLPRGYKVMNMQQFMMQMMQKQMQGQGQNH